MLTQPRSPEADILDGAADMVAGHYSKMREDSEPMCVYKLLRIILRVRLIMRRQITFDAVIYFPCAIATILNTQNTTS